MPVVTRTELARFASRAGLPDPKVRVFLRLQAGMRQIDAAEEVGVTRDAIASWESGRRVPRQPYLSRYVAFLDRLRQEVIGQKGAA